MKFNLPRVFKTFASTRSWGTADESGDERGRRSLLDFNFPFLGEQAIVDQPIQPGQRGRVWFQNSWWYALCEQDLTFSPGDVVDVVGLQEITLLVEPAFFCKPSAYGMSRVNQSISQTQQGLDDPQWLVDARDILTSSLGNSPVEAISTESWKRFIQGKPIYIDIFKAYCQVLGLDWKAIVSPFEISQASSRDSTELPSSTPPSPIPGAPIQTNVSPSDASPSDTTFVGRRGAIADLNALVDAGAKIIVVQGEGGLGKTTLARHFFAQSNVERVLKCWMAKETQHITGVESLVQEWLQRDLHEQPGQQLGVSLERLRRNLQTQRVGVLIDNLEPALDRHGQFIEAHRGYVDLLNVLSDPAVAAVTLVTSREPLHEASVNVYPYRLKGLDEMAWHQFFTNQQIQVDPSMLGEMHQSYGGNAKAMTILSSAVRMDYGGNLTAYWQENHADLLIETDLENLVTSHFDRLKQIYPEAYRLLCRLGCYRYQSIPEIPVEGVFCLLWDVPSEHHRRIVKFLLDLSMVEGGDGHYRLHPVIQAEAIALLKSSQDWEVSNHKAAEFWTTHIRVIETAEDALRALEAYYHYIQIDRPDLAATVILYQRDSQWEKSEPLGVSFYRLGLLKRMIAVIMPIIKILENGYPLSKLYSILGDLRWLTGDIQGAIACHEESRKVAIICHLKNLEIVSQFNVGLCQIELGELNEAVTFFNTVNALAENTEHEKYAVGSWFCLAYLYSCLGNNQAALTFARKVLSEYSKISSDSWSRGYSLLFLGRTFINLGDLDQAQQMFSQAQSYAEASHYIQVKAGALNGLAEIDREHYNFQAAIANHLAAKRLLETIEATCDLAEVYFQLGLTHQRMGELDKSITHFQAAIQLFEQIGASKQIEKVQQIMESISSKE
jgi:tetratricopeptide (TPR) repeat protein